MNGGVTMEQVLHTLDEWKSHDEQFASVFEKACQVIDRAMDLYTLERLCFSFNGGKDSCVVLHLIRIVLARRIQQQTHLVAEGLEKAIRCELKRMHIVYFDFKDQFPQVRSFIETMAETYDIQYVTVHGSYAKEIPSLLKDGGIQAFFMGVRGGDPRTIDMEHFEPSSKGWPAFMRINPILKWHYGHVWGFLRKAQLEYCSLYDDGLVL